MKKLQVRLISPWTTRVETESAVFSTDIPTQRADALLCEWAPSTELFSFPRRKAWYCCEPACQFNALGNGTWPKLKSRLGPHEFLWHGHADPRYRVPHITHYQPLAMNRNPNRKHRAVAIVSNHGGSPFRAHPDIRYRNRLITEPVVDLYGRSGWNRYRKHWYSWPQKPANYRGEIPGDWNNSRKRELMSDYKVCVCLENMNEPQYFSEKFIEAVQAGCVPVYRATKTIKQTVLAGAKWIDPGADDHSDVAAILIALAADLQETQEANNNWMLNNELLAITSSYSVFSLLATALAN
jgi:hypothetical protein